MSDKVAEILPFDYGAITDEHKSAIQEIITLAEQHGKHDFAEFLKVKFKIKEIPSYDLESSDFVKACKIAGLYCSIQGWVQEGVEPDIIKFPLIAMCADIRDFESLIPVIKNMVQNEN